MLLATMIALSETVRQIRFGNPDSEARPGIEAPRETQETPKGNASEGCETTRLGFKAMGLNHLDE
ncbi:MAG: hypothetical protein Q7K33_03080 [Candidatus Berkelbacteria bacterium]|nr:hypothetical protein [Candidatus Berkelbacteria bacterium]